jgi:hypothetical protein
VALLGLVCMPVRVLYVNEYLAMLQQLYVCWRYWVPFRYLVLGHLHICQSIQVL